MTAYVVPFASRNGVTVGVPSVLTSSPTYGVVLRSSSGAVSDGVGVVEAPVYQLVRPAPPSRLSEMCTWLRCRAVSLQALRFLQAR